MNLNHTSIDILVKLSIDLGIVLNLKHLLEDGNISLEDDERTQEEAMQDLSAQISRLTEGIEVMANKIIDRMVDNDLSLDVDLPYN